MEQGNFGTTSQEKGTPVRWICPNCETINQGESCVICGFHNIPETSGEENVWICPDCATGNRADFCTTCGRVRDSASCTGVFEGKGRTREERKKPVFKNIFLHKGGFHKKRTAIAAAAGMLILVAAVGWLQWKAILSEEQRYEQAITMLENGRHEQAIALFSQLGEYRDSVDRKKAACIAWAQFLEDQGEYQQALNVLSEYPEDVSASALTQEIHYRYALSLMDGEFELSTLLPYDQIYQELTAAGNFEDAEEKRSELTVQWAEMLLNTGLISKVVTFENLVTLSEEEGQEIYDLICNIPFFTDGVILGSAADVRGRLLEMLPDTYEHTEDLSALLEDLDLNYPYDYVKNNRERIRRLWDLPAIQDLITDDSAIQAWLLGKWEESWDQYIYFYEDAADDGIWLTYALPAVPEPEGAYYWNIRDMVLVWIDEDDVARAKVYGIELLTPDSIEVYCYQDQTYHILTYQGI